ncbi:hypothetical protein H1R20_g1676, partial [Candolleomyces eurysporus]
MALTLEQQLAQLGISPEDLKELIANKHRNANSAPPPPPEPQEEPGRAPVKIIYEGVYKDRAYHEQPSTFGNGKIQIKRASESGLSHVSFSWSVC